MHSSEFITQTSAPLDIRQVLDRLSLDNAIGKPEQRGRHGKVYRLRGFQVDDEHVSGRLFNRQIGGFGAAENSLDQRGGTVE
jgi:hypothetical protein